MKEEEIEFDEFILEIAYRLASRVEYALAETGKAKKCGCTKVTFTEDCVRDIEDIYGTLRAYYKHDVVPENLYICDTMFKVKPPKWLKEQEQQKK